MKPNYNLLNKFIHIYLNDCKNFVFHSSSCVGIYLSCVDVAP